MCEFYLDVSYIIIIFILVHIFFGHKTLIELTNRKTLSFFLFVIVTGLLMYGYYLCVDKIYQLNCYGK